MARALAVAVAVALVLAVAPVAGDARGHGGSGHFSSGSHSSGSHSSWSSASHRSTASHSTRSHSSGSTHHAHGSSHKASSGHGTSHGKTKRDPQQRRAFMHSHACPSTGRISGACPGYVVDHVTALKRGGADAPSNMQWQTVAAAKAKDKWE
jgi:hypothetical protein